MKNVLLVLVSAIGFYYLSYLSGNFFIPLGIFPRDLAGPMIEVLNHLLPLYWGMVCLVGTISFLFEIIGFITTTEIQKTLKTNANESITVVITPIKNNAKLVFKRIIHSAGIILCNMFIYYAVVFWICPGMYYVEFIFPGVQDPNEIRIINYIAPTLFGMPIIVILLAISVSRYKRKIFAEIDNMVKI